MSPASLFSSCQVPAMPVEDGPRLGDVAGASHRAARRTFLLATAALAASTMAPASAEVKTEIHDLRGTVRVNGQLATRKTRINIGDKIVTGSDGYIVFIVNEDAYMLRSRSELLLTASEDNKDRIGLLRLLTGAFGAVFRRASGQRRVSAGTITAGIRGTGIYVETRGDGTYFCTCWGTVDLASSDDPKDRETIESRNHTPRLVAVQATDGSRFRPAQFETHTNEEMDILEKCVGRRSPILFPEWFTK